MAESAPILDYLLRLIRMSFVTSTNAADPCQRLSEKVQEGRKLGDQEFRNRDLILELHATVAEARTAT